MMRQQRQGRRKTSLEHQPNPQPQHKDSNIIKTRMQTQNNLPLNPKSTRIPTRSTKNTSPPKPIPETRCSPSQSEEETKETELDESQDRKVCSQVLRKNHPQVQIYSAEIQSYILLREQKYMVDHGYLRNHKVLSPKMRIYLVRHIVKVCEKFSLLRSTLYLAVHYMDLYFSRFYLFRDQFEMVALAQACLFIAMKYEEIYPPDLGEWVDVRHKPEVLRLEAEVLKGLDFQLAHYTLDHFLDYHLWKKTEFGCQKIVPSDRTLLLMDMSLFDLTMKQFRPSRLAKCFHDIGTGGEVRAEQSERTMLQNIKWMIERNKQSLEWLLEHKYRHVSFKPLE